MIGKRTACVLAMAVGLGVLGACSSTKSSAPEDTVAPTDSAAPATDAPVTDPPTTPIPTSLAPTTTIEPAAFLRSDGLGAFNFGASYADMLAGMPLVVLSDDGRSFPTDRGDGSFDALDGESGFGYPSARVVCWDDGVGGYLCAYFGGADEATLGLVGWDYSSASGFVGPLLSESGATINILVSDVPLMPVIQGECYGYTNVFLDDIRLDLQAPSNETFGTYGDDGSYTLFVPAPAGAYVSYLVAGEQPYSYGEGADC